MTINNSYAPHIRRLVAAGIDGAIVSLIGFFISQMLGTDPYSTETTFANTVDNVLTLLAVLFYYVGFWSMRDGQTPGKQIMHLRVVREDGKKMDVFTGIIRVIGQAISGLVFSLGYLWILFDKKRQGWHDKMARTVVIVSDVKKPHGCITGLGCFIPVIIFALIGVGSSINQYGGFEKIASLLAARSKTSTNYMTMLKPEAKTIITKSNETFQQLNQEMDEAKVLELNNGNVTELTKATVIDPTNPIVWEKLASAYTWPTTVGTMDDGIQAGRKAVELSATANNYATLGNLLYRVKQYDEAVTTLKQAIRLDEKHNSAYYWLARAYAQLGIYDTARTEYQNAIDVLTTSNDTGKNDDTILMLQKESANLPK